MKNIVAIIVMCLISGLTVCQDQQKLDSLLTLFEKEKNDSIKVVLLLSAGDIFEYAEPEKALNFYEQALNYADEKKLDELKTKALRYIRIVHRDEGNWAGMWKWCSAGIVHAKKTGNMAETAVIYSDIGIKHDEMGNPDSSLFYYNRSLKIYLDLLKQDPENKVAIKGLAYGYNNIGMIYWQLGKTDNALEMYDKGIENSRKIGNIYSLTNQMLNKGKLYSQQGDYDKAMEMYEQSFNENVDFLKKCTGKQDSTNAQEGIGKSLSCMSYVYNYTGEYEKALEKLDLAVQKLKKGNKSHLGSCYFSIGQVYCNMGDYPGAIQNILHAVELFETARDVSNLAIALGKIGDILVHQKDYPQAEEYYNKSLKIHQDSKNKKGIASGYMDMGNLYHLMLKPDTALIYLDKAIVLCRELGMINSESSCLGTMGAIYDAMGKYELALEYYLKAKEIKEQINDRINLAIISNGIALTYYNLKDYRNAIKYAMNGLNISREIGAVSEEKDACEVLYTTYNATGDYRNGFKYLKLFMEAKDSLFNSEKGRIVSELETKYQTEKKEQEIRQQETAIAIQKAENRAQELQLKQERIIRFSFIGGFILVLALVVIVYRSYRQKKKANILLAMQNEQIRQQKEEIQAQRDLAAQQRDLIMEQKQEITDSIRYAYRIQTAAIPSSETLNEIVSDHFIMYKPRDIVSGDFYWIGRHEKSLIILAADCTGHGVPGAFMSMLGIAFLNEIVNKESITSPALILNKLRENIIRALQQKGMEGEQKDGMDVAVVTINPDLETIEFAGANNPLYLIRNQELIEKKGSKMPVAIHEIMDYYENHVIPIEKNDTLYIFSDGFPDQFGGPQGKKFKYKPFKELLISIQDNPMTEQEQILIETFENWRADYEQIDDVLVIGIKI